VAKTSPISPILISERATVAFTAEGGGKTRWSKFRQGKMTPPIYETPMAAKPPISPILIANKATISFWTGEGGKKRGEPC
jgi:hypothetical protein